MSRVKFKFTKNFVHGTGAIDKKGSTATVTKRMADFLKRNGYGEQASEEKKEDKEAAKRETK